MLKQSLQAASAALGFTSPQLLNLDCCLSEFRCLWKGFRAFFQAKKILSKLVASQITVVPQADCRNDASTMGMHCSKHKAAVCFDIVQRLTCASSEFLPSRLGLLTACFLAAAGAGWLPFSLPRLLFLASNEPAKDAHIPVRSGSIAGNMGSGSLGKKTAVLSAERDLWCALKSSEQRNTTRVWVIDLSIESSEYP